MRAHAAASVVAGALALAIAGSQGCMLLVGDGDYKVGAGDAASGGDAGGGGEDAGGGGGDAATMTCVSQPTDTTCGACVKSACCTEVMNCGAQTDCARLASCESSCTSSTCDCTQRSPKGVPLWLTLLSCAEKNCTACTAGLGDPCSSDAVCTSTNCACDPAACAGWCTNSCTTSADCAGDNSGGVNSFGQKGFCILNSANNKTCFPGCVATPDCAAFPGTVCEPTTTVENMNAQICTLPTGDAGM